MWQHTKPMSRVGTLVGGCAMTTITDTRTMTIVDYPLVRRLTANGTVLDSELGLTRDARGQHSLLLSTLLFPRGLYTLVARSEKQPVVGQFRYRPDDLNAHIVYIAPSLDDVTEDTVWLHILDAMAREAGKHGAHSLVAEVETNSHLFETLRTAGFAVYARQTIWRHAPVTDDEASERITLTEQTNNDQIGIMQLINAVVPTLLQQVAAPPSDMDGFVYRQNGRINGFIGFSQGKDGIYVLPYLHPEAMDDAQAIIEAALVRIERADKVPVYICVRSYQDWLSTAMRALNFEAWVEQAMMVKQLVAGIKHPGFARMKMQGKLEIIPCHNWSIIADDPANEDTR